MGLSTFGIAASHSESELRAVLRQLIALGAVAVDGQAFNTLHLTAGSRDVLKGGVQVNLRESVAAAGSGRARRRAPPTSAAAAQLDAQAQIRFINLKAWRAEVASQHNLPAYLIFHDATLAAIAQSAPQSLDALSGISGLGAKKLQAYGAEVLRVVAC